jgi:hypothetical protein
VRKRPTGSRTEGERYQTITPEARYPECRKGLQKAMNDGHIGGLQAPVDSVGKINTVIGGYLSHPKRSGTVDPPRFPCSSLCVPFLQMADNRTPSAITDTPPCCALAVQIHKGCTRCTRGLRTML